MPTCGASESKAVCSDIHFSRRTDGMTKVELSGSSNGSRSGSSTIAVTVLGRYETRHEARRKIQENVKACEELQQRSRGGRASFFKLRKLCKCASNTPQKSTRL